MICYRPKPGKAILLSLILGLAAAVLPIRPCILHAQTPPPGAPFTPGSNIPQVAVVGIRTGPDGVVVVIRTVDRQPGQPGTNPVAPVAAAPSNSGSGAPRCTVGPLNIGNASASGWFGAQAPDRPGEAPHALYCDGNFQGVIWLPTTTNASNVRVVEEPGGPSVDPLTLARGLLDQIPLPTIRLRFNPDTGLVALPSWFWIEGYDGEPIRRLSRLGNYVVEVELAPSSYRWSFGDGATLATKSVGKPYPQESDVRHTYERSSLGAGGSFAVTMELTFLVRFRVNGGGWQTLAPIARSYSAPYPVQQVQSILTNR